VVGVVAGSTFIPPTDPNIQYIGRVAKSNPTLYQFGWASVQIVATFAKSTSISISLHDNTATGPSYWGDTIYYDVYIDGVFVMDVNSSKNALTSYTLAQGLSLSTQHTVKIARRVEAAYGVSGFAGFTLDDGGSLIPSPPRPAMRLEFLGDSITCGWGTLGHAPCSDQPQLENSEKTWATVAAKAIGADYSVISWSGQGMVRHYGCPNITCNDSMPSLYPRTIGMDASPLWDFSSWIPQAVIINLATNDYGSQPYPPTPVFVKGYTEFVQTQILPPYGKNVTVFATCFFNGLVCENVQAAYNNLKAVGVNAVFVSFAAINVANSTGCDGHPGVPQQAAWANYLAPIVKSTMGW